MKRVECAAFHAIVYYEAFALSTHRVPPITHYVARLPRPLRMTVALAGSAWLLAHFEAV